MSSSSQRKLPVPLERDIQRSVLAIARGLGFRMDRRNTGAMSGRYKGKAWFMRFGQAGDSDLTGQVTAGPNRGLRLDIEIKRPGNRPTPLQVAKLRETIASGGLAFWTDSGEIAFRALSAILAGGWVEIDEDGNQTLHQAGGRTE